MFQKLTAIGRIGKDIELSTMQNGEEIAKFSLAISKSWKDKNGNKQDKTEWLNCVLFGKRAGVLAQYVGKGSLLHIEGELNTNKYTDKNGVDKVATNINVNNFTFIDSKKDIAPQGEQFPQDNSNDLDNMPFSFVA